MSEGSRRTQRLSSLLRGELAKLFLYEVSDPIVAHLVINEVEISKDLRYAKVFYVRPAGSAPVKESDLKKGLARVQGFLRKRIADELELRFVPELTFTLDTHGEELNKLLGIMGQVDTTGKKEAQSSDEGEPRVV